MPTPFETRMPAGGNVSAEYLPFDLSPADYLERGIIGMITIDARGLLPIERGFQRRGE